MKICSRMTIIPLSIVLYYCLTKTSRLTFIRFHNVRPQSCWMSVKTSVRAPSWHDEVRACAFTRLVHYPQHKFRLKWSFYYLWLWNHSVLTSYHFLSADYFRVRLVHFFSFFLCLYAVETFFVTIFLCLHVVSCPVSFCLHTGLDSFSSCIHVGINLFLV